MSIATQQNKKLSARLTLLLHPHQPVLFGARLGPVSVAVLVAAAEAGGCDGDGGGGGDGGGDGGGFADGLQMF